MDNSQPPCKVEDTLVFNFNFDNLQKFLSYLHKNDLLINEKIRDFNIKLSELEEIRSKIEETEFQINTIQKKFPEIDHTLFSYQNKILETESNLSNLNIRMSNSEIKVSNLIDKTSALEDNVNNLNRLTE